jgi:hypothetical protein
MKRKAAYGLVALLWAAMVCASVPTAAAPTSYTWNGGTGFWHEGTKWTPTGVPTGNGDTASVPDSGSIVNLNGWYANSATNLAISPDAEVRTTITSPNYDTYFSPAAPSGSATMTNDGIFRLADTGKNSWIFPASSLSISGSGRIIMESSAKSQIHIESPYSITNGAHHTIEGVGTIDPYAMSNYGMIQADPGPLGGRLLMARNFYNFTGGVLSSSPGAVLQLGIWYNSSSGLNFGYDGRGGSIDLNGGTVKAEVADFINASITNSGAPSGTLELVQSLSSFNQINFHGNTNLGSGVVVNVNNNVSMYASGTERSVITNDGVINLKAASDGYSNFLGSNCTLTGRGRLVLNGYAKSLVGGGYSDSVGLINDVNHTLEGGGTLSDHIANNGTILANNGTLILDGIITGTGQVLVKDAAKVIIAAGRYPYNRLTTQNLLMTENAAIQVEWYCSVIASQFSYAMTDPSPSKWFWDSDSTLYMTGTGPEHYLEVGGRTDLPDPWVNNFVIPNLVISGNITLVDIYHNTGSPVREALYVNKLTVSPGAILNLNSLQLFCYLNGDMHQVMAGEGDLFGGGQIINRPLKSVVAPIQLLLLDN